MQLRDTLEKIQSTSQQIASKLKRDCQCVIESAYITAAQFSCDQETTHVIYRARISSTPDVSNVDLLGLLQEWVTSGSASVTLDHIHLDVDASCTVIIDSLSDPLCPFSATTPELLNPATVAVEESSDNLILYVTPAVVLFAMIVIVVFICAFMIYQRRFSSYNLRLVNQQSI